MNQGKFVYLLILISLALPPVLASPVDLRLIDPVTGNHYSTVNPLVACPRPITYPEDIRIYLTNLGAYPDTYSLSLELPEGWEGQIENQVTLDAGQTKELSLFLVNPPYPWQVEPGLYQVKVSVQSNSDPTDRVEKTFPVQILLCYGVEVQPEEGYLETCEETEKVETKITVKNLGKQRERFELKAMENGQEVDWVEFSRPIVALEPDESQEVTLTIRPERGDQELEIVAESLDSWVSGKTKIQLKVNNCYDFDLELKPDQQEVCLGKAAQAELWINNLGKRTTIRLNLPERMLDVSLAENGTTKVPLTLTNLAEGENVLRITAYSLNEPDKQKEIEAKIQVKPCRKVSLDVQPEEVTVCRNGTARFRVIIRNEGSSQDSFDFWASMGSYSYQKVDLQPDASLSFWLEADMAGKEAGTYEIELKAWNEGTQASRKVRVKVEKCWDVDLELQPKSFSVCACSKINLIARVKNTGKYQDSYILEFAGKTVPLVLKPNQSQVINLSYSVSCQDSGRRQIPIRVSSSKAEDSEYLQLEVQPKNRCWAVQLQAEEPAQVELYKAITIPIRIENLGSQPDSYLVELAGPEWLEIQPKNLSLEPGKEGMIYVYASPGDGVEPGRYSAQVKVQSKYVTSFASFDVEVFNPGELPEPKEWSITGMFSAISVPFWKAVIVGIITLGIIVVLTLKLAYYFRR